ncbi:MAG: hypothetical protein UX26_C0001G0023 [Parcubacteria group bacterium GW2011_GWC1_45_9]|nr:MAG: hypothetical protein UW89_C0005G0012 [Parcubacteria group bacterium GW2011_GWB1_45_10]KKU17453.1 MAG: hypothetical protein UX26_C0001G0023 [Parcubacteria group bacterium GW2011_GWC1_45_9]HCI05542.1 hypothetical protein [Patescibacteria group bacterium]
MFTKLFNYLRDLKKKPKKTRESLYSLVMLILVPLIIFFLLISIKGSIGKALANPGEQISLGDRLIEVLKGFFGKVQQGLVLIFQGGRDFFSSEKFYNFFRLILGKPKIQIMEPGEEINLPVPQES